MDPIMDCCCGVDVHKDMLEVCIIKDGFENPQILHCRFGTIPYELQKFTDWLSENDCHYVAMESTGVYWRPVYEKIEDIFGNTCTIIVANAHNMRNLPGRKSDIKDAEWIATLLMHGLLEPSFVPDRVIRDLREFSRTYKNSISEKSRCINRLEKFLNTHGFKLSSVLSDITSVSGLKILTILSEQGYLTLDDVEKAKSGHTKHTAAEIQSAVCGTLNTNEKFLLADFLDQYNLICNHINKIIDKMKEIAAPYQNVIEKLDSIVGIDIIASLLILAEIGDKPQANFKDSQHLCSWAGLSPRNDESANKIKSRKILPGNPYLKSILCQCARVAVRQRNNPFNSWYWSHKNKIGDKKSIIAVSRKMLKLIYHLIVTDTLYDNSKALEAVSKAT